MENLLIFLHIPKCAGVTFYQVLDKNFPKHSVFSIDGQTPWDSVNSFLKSDPNKLRQIQLIRGHFPYGIHQFLPHENYKYITFVRKPIERLNSLYRYAQNYPYHRLYSLAIQNDLSTFALNSMVPDNLQTKFVAGVNRDQLHQPCTQEIYCSALRNLEVDFLPCCLVERFDESMLMLYSQNIIKIPFFSKTNVTNNSNLILNHSSSVIERLEKRHQWDLMLYKYAEAKFAKLKIEKISRFKFLNQIYIHSHFTVRNSIARGLQLFL